MSVSDELADERRAAAAAIFALKYRLRFENIREDPGTGQLGPVRSVRQKMLPMWSFVSCGVLAHEFLEADSELARRALIEKWRADIARAEDNPAYTPHITLTNASLPGSLADDIALLRVNRGRVTALAKAIRKAADPLGAWDIQAVVDELALPSTRTVAAVAREIEPFLPELYDLVNEAYRVRPDVFDQPEAPERAPRPAAEIAEDAGTKPVSDTALDVLLAINAGGGLWQDGKYRIAGVSVRSHTTDFLIRQGYLEAAPANFYGKGALTGAGKALIESDDPRIIEAFLDSAIRQIARLMSGGTDNALRQVEAGTPEHLRE